MTSVSLSQSDLRPLNHVHTPVTPLRAQITKAEIPPAVLFSVSYCYCYLLSSQKAQVAGITFCRMAAVPALLFPLLIFPVMGFFFPGHLLGWFDSQGIIFFSPEKQEETQGGDRKSTGFLDLKRFPFWLEFPQEA